MAYDPSKEQTVVIGKEYHTMLKAIAEIQKRNLRTTLELLIEATHDKTNETAH